MKILSSFICLLLLTSQALADSNGKVKIEGYEISPGILEIEINAEKIELPVIGSAFHLYYPEELKFLAYYSGDFLERGGDPIYLVKDKGDKVIYGSSLKRDDNFPLESGTLVKMQFEIVKGEVFNFQFKNAELAFADSIEQELNQILFEDGVVDLTSQNQINAYSNDINGGQNENNFVRKVLKFWYMPIMAAISIYLVYMLKKGSMKSHLKYVNFK